MVLCYLGKCGQMISLLSISQDGECFPRLDEILGVAVWDTCPGSDG